jgi:hypothetical protein
VHSGGLTRILATSQLLLLVSVVAAPDPAIKKPPPPSEGTISPSGKFTPARLAGVTNIPPPKTPEEAEAALKNALNVQQTGPNTFQIGRVTFDKQQRSVTLPARVTIRTQVIEYALVTEQGKAYESLLTTEASPTDIHLAFLLLGVSPVGVGGELRTAAVLPATNAVRVEVNWETNGHPISIALADWIGLANTPAEPSARFALDQWLYNGSVIDPNGFAAQREGSIVALIRDPAALINNPGADRDNDAIHWPNLKVLPPEGTRLHITFRLPPRPAVPSRPPPPWVTPITPLSTNKY